MLKTRYGVPYWRDRLPGSRKPSYRAHRGHLECDVIVAGGGLTGCATAYVFAAAGVNVVLLEASRIGEGGTSAGAGLVLHDPEVRFRTLESTYGLKVSRHIWQATRRGALDLTATIRRLDIKCGLEAQDSVEFATGDESALLVRREYQARRAAGVEASFIKGEQLRRGALSGSAAIRMREVAHLDPYRACLGFAAAAAGRGAQLFERTMVKRVRFTRKDVEVQTAAGTARATTLVVATGSPTSLFSPLQRHFARRESYLTLTQPLNAAMRRATGPRKATLRDFGDPPHHLRWMSEDRILFTGADQPETPQRIREKTIIQRTGQLMYELSTWYPEISGLLPTYGWSAPYSRTVDGVPYIGPHRNYPHHLFALGFGAHSVSFALLAGRILLRHHLREPERADDVFAFTRTL
jgi:glycine/D-amino acid oxidase-like deaminating enzyme